ncbi:acyltransferase family protein [Notoacmeibacter ruber]|uniref:Acyltransferase n=1 Tax=Notoacmeibacter ruber TaxID=2670375 RepID=A0A3L7J3E5_9HYPH|nr:acyltransferase family protein [Notoacmeibacter ruber]RLQ85000.1 acyltransferase [Notoacmeibacter ruber]
MTMEQVCNRNTYRPEIQGLRALAVALVVLFHVWPQLVPGGYIGVDVFFVISGYLICGSLARGAAKTGHVGLLDFYARRIRRLLPVATLVLVFVAVGSFFFVGPVHWGDTARQIVASALYLQNWLLAFDAVDYLGADNAPTALQHYWSLAIEEQFYVVWPLAMIGCITISRYPRWSLNKVLMIAIGIVFAASLACSIAITANDPAWAYFVTHTRAFELALGGLLALAPKPAFNRGARIGLSVAGITAIVVAAFAYTTATAFPGAAALVPTLGAAALIAAGDVRAGPYRGLNYWPLRRLGDISYSVYLWHWPLIIFATPAGQTLGLVSGIVIIALTLVLSVLSWRHVEERFRHTPERSGQHGHGWGVIRAGAAMVALCLVGAASVQAAVWRAENTLVDVRDPRYPGPAVLANGVSTPEGIEPIPPLAALKKDLPIVYPKNCHQNQTDADPLFCELGDPKGSLTVAIAGESHAAQWVPALDEIAKARGWRLLTFTKSACLFAATKVRRHDETPYVSCDTWQERVSELLLQSSVDVLFVSFSRSHAGRVRQGQRSVNDGLFAVWSELNAAGISIIAIEDTPRHRKIDPRECLVENPMTCRTSLEDAYGESSLAVAASRMDDVGLIEMTDLICTSEWCPATLGNVIVWRDTNHLTATYSRMLAPYLAERIDRVLAKLKGGPTLQTTLEVRP